MSIGSLAHTGRLPMADPFKGTRLGDYNVIELLGKGGMASVYRGYDLVLERDVAIKVISTVGQSTDFVTRFKHEARLVASLRHPNIVQIYHFGEQRDCVYMVQELLSGPTLEQRIHESRCQLTPIEINAVVEQVARALDFAHSRAVIHRDVKPSNILCNDHGHWVLTDFGIASSNAEPPRATSTVSTVMGTPSYVAPEQAISSATVTTSCDIYSLGVVLFELLTGRLPFEANTAMEIVLRHLYDDPPYPSSMRSDLPLALNTVVLRALNKKPDERYARAIDLVQDLRTAWPAAQVHAPAKAVASAPRLSQTRSTPTTGGYAQRIGAPAHSVVRQELPTAQRTNGSAQHTTTPRSDLKPIHTSVAMPHVANRTACAWTTTSPTSMKSMYPVRSSVWRRARVGLLTANLVGALILYGSNPHILGDAWMTVQLLLATWIKLP